MNSGASKVACTRSLSALIRSLTPSGTRCLPSSSPVSPLTLHRTAPDRSHNPVAPRCMRPFRPVGSVSVCGNPTFRPVASVFLHQRGAFRTENALPPCPPATFRTENAFPARRNPIFRPAAPHPAGQNPTFRPVSPLFPGPNLPFRPVTSVPISLNHNRRASYNTNDPLRLKH